MDSMLNDHLLHSFGRAAYSFIEGLSEFSSGVPAPARLSRGLVLDWANARCRQEINNAAASTRLRSLLTNMRLSFPNIFPAPVCAPARNGLKIRWRSDKQ